MKNKKKPKYKVGDILVYTSYGKKRYGKIVKVQDSTTYSAFDYGDTFLYWAWNWGDLEHVNNKNTRTFVGERHIEGKINHKLTPLYRKLVGTEI